ncbi:MAG: hypothetical protein LBD97_08950, partial [Bifidobacteriaceae bacterium]|nr:hypothetical protein [Bifidobacteriaceae bacterium]
CCPTTPPWTAGTPSTPTAPKTRSRKRSTTSKTGSTSAPPRVHNHQTLTGKLVAVFAALTLTSELRRRVTQAGLHRQWTARDILDELEAIERYQADGRQARVLHVTKKQNDLYTALGAQTPTTS